MAGSKRGGTSWKTGYTSYKASDRCAKNKARRVAKHQAAHPADKQAADCKLAYTRKESGNKGGWVTGKVFAVLGDYLGIRKEDPIHNVSRSRAVLTRVAQHLSFDKGVRNEHQFIRPGKPKKDKKKA